MFEATSFELEQGDQTFTIQVSDLHFSPWRRMKTTRTMEPGEGLASITTEDECVSWGSDMDTKWVFVRAITVITPVVGGIMTLVLFMTPCLPKLVAKAWYGMAATYIVLLTLFQGLGFLIYRTNACEENPVARAFTDEITTYAESEGIDTSQDPVFDFDAAKLWDDECSWDKGSSLNVVSVVCWFLAGLVMLALGPPTGGGEESTPVEQGKGEEQQEQPAAQEQEEEEVEEGGDAADSAE